MFTRKENGKSRISALLCVLAVSGLTGGHAAAAIVYGDYDDIPPGNIMYTDVTESSATDPVPPPLYGAPDITGNNLDFDPTAFGATAMNGAPTADITDGQLNFGFMTTSGYGLSSLTISESGDFTLFGTGTAVTSVGAGIFANIEITHVNGVALVNPLVATGSSTFTTNLVATPGLNQFWQNALTVDFASLLEDAGFNPQTDLVTKGEVAINNTLVAISEPNPATIAFIAKKDFKINASTVVPEPGSVALLALGGMCLLRRRR